MTKMNKDAFKSIQKAAGVSIQLSPKMQKALREWSKAYTNESAWINEDVESLNLPATVASEISRLVTVESVIKISGSRRADYIDKQLNNFRINKKDIIEMACAL